MDVDGQFPSSGQQIWTLMDVRGRSGNTLKVPGSRPGRPTKFPPEDYGRSRSWIPTVAILARSKEIPFLTSCLIEFPAPPASLEVDTKGSEEVGQSLERPDSKPSVSRRVRWPPSRQSHLNRQGRVQRSPRCADLVALSPSTHLGIPVVLSSIRAQCTFGSSNR